MFLHTLVIFIAKFLKQGTPLTWDKFNQCLENSEENTAIELSIIYLLQRNKRLCLQIGYPQIHWLILIYSEFLRPTEAIRRTVSKNQNNKQIRSFFRTSAANSYRQAALHGWCTCCWCAPAKDSVYLCS